jgi:hypothetical protein
MSTFKKSMSNLSVVRAFTGHRPPNPLLKFVRLDGNDHSCLPSPDALLVGKMVSASSSACTPFMGSFSLPHCDRP